MQVSLKFVKCPNQAKVHSACVSNNCKSPSPFQCATPTCTCSTLHAKCKNMRWESVVQYLTVWQQYISKDGKEYIDRMNKLYANIRQRLDRQQAIFKANCRDLFMGKDYTALVCHVEKRQFSKISPLMMSSALKKITEGQNTIGFQEFSIREMKEIDQKITALFNNIEQIYKRKQIKTLEPDKIKRCNSATLQRQTSCNNNGSMGHSQISAQKQKDNIQSIMLIKTDLTYPKTINSRIVNQASALNRIICKKIQKYHLVYRASQNGYSIAEFYRKINLIQKQIMEKSVISSAKIKEKHYKTPQFISLILVKSEHGKILGGYTALKWENKQEKLQAESQDDEFNPEKYAYSRNKTNLSSKLKTDILGTSYMFALDTAQKYNLMKAEEAIYCGKSSIGFGKSDLKIVDKSHQHRKSVCKFPISYNYSRQPYVNASKSGMNMIGSKYSQHFKVDEWEAFLVQL